MSLRNRIQEGIKEATKARDQKRLETLRMAKGAIILKEKEKSKDAELTDAEIVEALRAEVKKRQQSLDIYQNLDKAEEVTALEQEIRVLEEFLPQQLSPEQTEVKVREYLASNPAVDHPGKLTGALKKELGDIVDGKVLNEACRKVLGK